MSHSTKTFLAIAVTLVIALGVLYGYVFSRIFTARASLGELVQQVAQSEQQEKDLDRTRQILAETEAERAALHTLFLKESDVVSVIEKVEALGAQGNIALDIQSVEIIESSKEAGSEPRSWLKLIIMTDGAWEGTHQFLALLERLPYVLVLDAARLEITDVEDSASSWEGSFTVRIAIEEN